MADLMKRVQEACKNRKLDIPELKTAEGAVALSECMDTMTGPAGQGRASCFEKAVYAAAALMNWLDSVPLDVFCRDRVGIPAIMERIRKIHDGSFFAKGGECFPIGMLEYLGLASRSLVYYSYERRDAWKLPYDFEKIKAMKENGYLFDWHSYSGNDIEKHPGMPWCDLIRILPKAGGEIVYEVCRLQRRDILECMKEYAVLSDAKVNELLGSLETEPRKFFRSVWYEEQEKSPEISLVEDLFTEADRLAAEMDAYRRLSREKQAKSSINYQSLDEQLWKARGKICSVVSGSPDVFCAERELVKRALAHAPMILLSGEWRNDRELYELAFGRVEQIYAQGGGVGRTWYSTDLVCSSKKEEKDARLNAFKSLYPTDEEKRAFLKAYPTCAILGGFHGACSKKIREDLAFWTDIYAQEKYDCADLPTALKKNQDFLKMCEPVRHIRDFEKFFVYETAEDLEFALAQREVLILPSKLPEALKTRENICRILEHASRGGSYMTATLDEIDISLFSDEEFVVGAAAYEIGGWICINFFSLIDKSLRKLERVWKAWGTKERIGSIQKDIPMTVKKSRAYIEHLLAIGNGVCTESDVFAEAWKNFPDLSDALVDEYAKEVSEKEKDNGNSRVIWARSRAVRELPDEQLRELVLQKLSV